MTDKIPLPHKYTPYGFCPENTDIRPLITSLSRGEASEHMQKCVAAVLDYYLIPKPIETAPRDGTVILAFDAGGRSPYITEWVLAHDIEDTWLGRGGWFSGNYADIWRDRPIFDTPTHWLPFPPKPETDDE